MISSALSSMRARLTVYFTGAAAAFLLFASGGLLLFAWRTAEREVDARLQSAAAQFRAESGSEKSEGALAEAREEREQLVAQGVAVGYYGPDGRLLWASGPSVPPMAGQGPGKWRTVSVTAGSETAVFGVPWEAAERALRREAVALLALSLLTLLGTAAGAWVLVGRTLSPIDRLTQQAARASADALDLRLVAPSRDAEVVGFVATLNGFLDRLHESAAARQRFYAAASHELRTPLQALKGHLQLALTRKRTTEEYEAAIAEANEQTDALSRLVQDLLALNRLESRAGETAAEPVDLAGAVARAVDAYADLAERRRVRVQISGPDTVCVKAPESHVGILVRNLVENAVKYTRPSGRVEVTLEADPMPRLTVENETGPVARLDADRLFEPFYRPDAARSPETGGNGLGLALCKSAADANGWRVSLVQGAETVRVSVTFGARAAA